MTTPPRFSAEQFRQKTRKTMELYTAIHDHGPEVERLITDSLKAIAEEWKVYERIPDIDRLIKGTHLSSVDPNLYLLEDGQVGLVVDKARLEILDAPKIIGKYKALNFLEKLDAQLELTIATHEPRANDLVAALAYNANKKIVR